MKKSMIFAVLLAVLTLSGCAEGETLAPDLPAEGVGLAETEASGGNSASAVSEKSAGEIDVDLTKMSSTMVYSEVYNMMASPERYIGSTIKMDGEFALYHDEATDEYYFACVIQDATACCAQGIEFVLTEDYRYPDDYPKPGDEICVVGVFDTYKEGNYTY